MSSGFPDDESISEVDRAHVVVYVTEQPDGPARFAAHEEINRPGGGTYQGEIRWSHDPEQLVIWAKGRSDSIVVRTEDGRIWWEGPGPIPEPDPSDELTWDDPVVMRWPEGWTSL